MASYALAGAAFFLMVNALVGENGYLATLRASRETSEVEAQLRQVREKNQQLRERIKRLRSDPNELEDAARKELHMSKPGETTVILKDAPPTKSSREPGK
jgi:cell division protein FtsB